MGRQPRQRSPLVLGVSVGCVDAQHVHLGIDKSGNPVLVVMRVDRRSGDPPLALIDNLKREVQLILNVFSKHEVLQQPLAVKNRQHRLMSVHQPRIGRGKIGRPDKHIQFASRNHPLLNGKIGMDHRVVIALRQQAKEGTVFIRHRERRIAGLRLQLLYVIDRRRRRHGQRTHEPCLVVFDFADFVHLIADRLGTGDERGSAALRQFDRHLVHGDGSHRRRDQRNIEGPRNRSFARPGDRRSERDPVAATDCRIRICALLARQSRQKPVLRQCT